MARRPRMAVPAYPHHIIQRGNNRQAIFFTEDDYRYYIASLRQAKSTCQCRLYAYVLMTNHVHLLVEPTQGKEKVSGTFYALRYAWNTESSNIQFNGNAWKPCFG